MKDQTITLSNMDGSHEQASVYATNKSEDENVKTEAWPKTAKKRQRKNPSLQLAYPQPLDILFFYERTRNSGRNGIRRLDIISVQM